MIDRKATIEALRAAVAADPEGRGRRLWKGFYRSACEVSGVLGGVGITPLVKLCLACNFWCVRPVYAASYLQRVLT